MKTKQFLFLFLIVTQIIVACRRDSVDCTKCESITSIGIIRDIPPEDNCGAFMIITEKTETHSEILYKPENLSAKFKIDNLKVEFTYQLTNKKHNCGYGGYVQVVKILKIKKI